MAHRILPLALTLSVMTAGCAQTLLANSTGKADSLPAQVAGARHAPSGFGKVKVDVRGLQQAPGFHTAAMLGVSVGKGVLIVRDSSDAIVTDVSGNPAAYYFAVPSAGNATVAIPELPSTATSTTTAVTTGNPYTFELRAFTSAQTVALLGDNFHVDTTAGTFATEITELTHTAMKASGEAKAHVVAGLPVVVTIDSFANFGANIDNTSGSEIRAVTLTGATTVTEGTTTGILRTRITSVKSAKLGAVSGQAKAAFTVGGTPKAGDKFTVTVNDNQDTPKVYVVEYTVPSGGETAAASAAGIASAITTQAANGTGATAKYPDTYSASSAAGVLTVSGAVASGSFANFTVATATVTSPTVKPYDVTEVSRVSGDSVTAYQSDQHISALSGTQEGDVVTYSFTNTGGTTISGSYTVTSSDTEDTIASALRGILEAADTGNQYTFGGIFNEVTITANAVGAAFDVAAGGVTVTEAHTVGGTIGAATIENLTKRFRILLQFPTGVSTNTLWTVKDKSGNPVKNSTGASVSGLVGTKLFAGVTPVPTNVNTQHWVDIDDETAGRRFADGFLDVTVTGVPTFTNIQVIDHVLGNGAQSSTTVK